MINNKLIIGMAIISIVYTGCDDKQTTPTTSNPVVEKKVEISVDKIVPKVEQTVKKVEVIAPIITKVQEVTSTPNGMILYKKCSGCHGLNGEKKALNKSAIIKGWDALKITHALKGYKSGTYGGAMKGIMKGQLAAISDKEIALLSEHISNFK